MLIELPGLMALSNDVNALRYWEPSVYPSWSRLNIVRLFSDQEPGRSAEPHFHDVDEYWLFANGYGEVGLGAERFEVTPNTVVYTPPGVVHRFVMYTPSNIAAVVRRLLGNERTGHLWAFNPALGNTGPGSLSFNVLDGYVDAHDTVDVAARGDAFLVPGVDNDGRPWSSGAGPLSELRWLAGQALDQLREPWRVTGSQALMVAAGSVRLRHEHGLIEMVPGDLVLARDGTQLRAEMDGEAVVVRVTERSDP